MKKILTILLAVVLCVGAIFSSACSADSVPYTSGYTSGTHIQEKESTGKYLLKDGKTNYKIVVPKSATTNENIAAGELVTLFKEGTGIQLAIVADDDVSYTEDSYFISVGNTSFLEDREFNVSSSSLGVNGTAIRSAGNSIFIIGGSEYGICYAVYEFITQILNFEQYYIDSYYIDTGVRDIELMNYNITELPDIKRSVGGTGFLNADVTTGRRMRSPYTLNTITVWIKGHATHVGLVILSKDDYQLEHSKWYSDDGSQLCYTAHGDSTEYEAMICTYLENIEQAIIASPDKPMFVVGDMDENKRCTCEQCAKNEKKYGCCSGSKILFINEVRKRLDDWGKTDTIGKTVYKEDFLLTLLAYYDYEQAPAVYDSSTGKYKPVAKEIVLDKGVGVQIAPIATDFTSDYTAEINKSFYETLLGWESLTENISWWVYSTNFSHYMYPYNTFDTMQQRYQVYARIGAQSLMDQSQLGNYKGATAWHILKAYLESKLAWDTNVDLNGCIDRFFDNYFGEGSEAMRKYFDSYRVFSVYQKKVLGAFHGTKTVGFDIDKREYWPQNILYLWRDYIGEALDAIASIKNTDKDRYNTLYSHIVGERASVDFILIDLYESLLGKKYNEYKQDFIEAVTLNNITSVKEGGDMATYIANMN